MVTAWACRPREDKRRAIQNSTNGRCRSRLDASVDSNVEEGMAGRTLALRRAGDNGFSRPPPGIARSFALTPLVIGRIGRAFLRGLDRPGRSRANAMRRLRRMNCARNWIRR
jgi:hypothetical protein